MLEFSIARKYLTPRWRQLSVSIISLISILVIALVVWLIVVFFSVTYGLEKNWISKLIALTAPVRITPTEAYYRSYYYQVDSISERGDFAFKTIAEKRHAIATDPYNPQTDEAPPLSWPAPDKNSEGHLKDLVKLVFGAIDSIRHKIPGLSADDFEMTTGNIHLQLIRKTAAPQHPLSSLTPYSFSSLEQSTYLGSFDQNNPALTKALLPLNMQDLSNLYMLTGIAFDPLKEEENDPLKLPLKEEIQERLSTFFKFVQVRELKTPSPFWPMPKNLWPENGTFQSIALQKKERLTAIVIAKETRHIPQLLSEYANQGYHASRAVLEFRQGKPWFKIEGKEVEPLSPRLTIALEGDLPLSASLVESSIEQAARPSLVQFRLSFYLQGIPFHGEVPYGSLQIAKADFQNTFSEALATAEPFWMYEWEEKDTRHFVLPASATLGEGILLPRNFREAGILMGDRGFLAYMTPTTSSIQEQRIPIFVAGFYDPGVIPIGGKFAIVNKEITSLIRSSHNQEQALLSNGINIRFNHLDQADEVKNLLQTALNEMGIAPYWRIETYREYEFTKDLIGQLRSEKNLFSLLAMIIIIVACSNIISMLVILVNDKKIEIGILRSMGATSWTIATIFGWCGMVMGCLGSLIGTIAAMVTLKNLQPLINLLSKIQGYEMFNPIYYGETLPAELSFETLGLVILATALISCLAGLIPAVKASLLRPSAILRSE